MRNQQDEHALLRIDFCAQRWNPDDPKDDVGRRQLVMRLAMSVPTGTADAEQRIAKVRCVLAQPCARRDRAIEG